MLGKHNQWYKNTLWKLNTYNNKLNQINTLRLNKSYSISIYD